MADPQAALKKKRQNILAEIQRRGGRGKAPGFEAQLKEVEGQLRAGRNTITTPGAPSNGLGPTLNAQMPSGQQDVLAQGTALTGQGQKLAAQNLTDYKQFNMGQDVVGDRARIEDEVFGRLTRNTQADYDREKQQMEQTLYNRGIAINPADPNYKANIDSLNNRYDTLKSDARAQATQMGGEELARSYGMAAGTHEMGLSDAERLGNIGYGTKGTEFDLAYKQFAEQQRAAKAAEALAKKQLAQNKPSGGGGGGGTPAPTQNIFNTGLPPGIA